MWEWCCSLRLQIATSLCSSLLSIWHSRGCRSEGGPACCCSSWSYTHPHSDLANCTNCTSPALHSHFHFHTCVRLSLLILFHLNVFPFARSPICPTLSKCTFTGNCTWTEPHWQMSTLQYLFISRLHFNWSCSVGRSELHFYRRLGKGTVKKKKKKKTEKVWSFLGGNFPPIFCCWKIASL